MAQELSLQSIGNLAVSASQGLAATAPQTEETTSEPTRGTLTWASEGQASPTSPFYSRRAHVPDTYSGVTIGRGYDLKLRSRSEIITDLTAAGLSVTDAARFAEGRGKKGAEAKEFIRTTVLPELTTTQEVRLFNTEYNRLENDVRRISGKADVVQTYGATDWENLNPTIKEVLVDLRYRGDYTPATRSFIQESVAANDLNAFGQVINDRTLWTNVPRERFKLRNELVQKAIADQEN